MSSKPIYFHSIKIGSKKACIASYYSPFSTNIKINIIKLKLIHSIFVNLNLIIFHSNIRGKLFKIQYDKHITRYSKKGGFCSNFDMCKMNNLFFIFYLETLLRIQILEWLFKPLEESLIKQVFIQYNTATEIFKLNFYKISRDLKG